ncbi:hypothetical protein C4578_03715 [Candidatus Microgenomates bacterium]|jgi:arsenate reductase-like glutaredoxin family protein|nr:MAG: hypothetical protein C4578_03715 [Candidatus Microgenomates bacterium]
MKKGLLILFVLLLSFLGIYFYSSRVTKKTNGVILLSENTGDISGYYVWEKELDAKGLKAIIKPERSVLEKYPDYFKKLADKGYEIATGYGEAPFWEMPYEEQYKIMKEYKEYAEKITGKPIKIFSSKYFAYDENTLKAADALGIPYILARGSGIKAAIYSPEEYKTKLISVSNLVFEDMGSGSLCDASLFQRGSTADDFKKVLDDSFNEKPRDLVLVSHVYIGGTRKGWWDAYASALVSEKVQWRNFDSWVGRAEELKMPYSEIPYNTEVKYVVPKPAVPLEELELIPDLKTKESITVFHNGKGPMCLEFIEFAKTLDFPVEQHLDTEEKFYETLESYKSKFPKSQGVSESFGYYPIIFLNNKAYSGFNEEIKKEILKDIGGDK